MVPHLLAPFGDDSRISQFLLRIALMDETPASSAVLQGILALSSLKLYGGAEAFLFKSKAISMPLLLLSLPASAATYFFERPERS